MYKVLGINFTNSNKIYYFSVNNEVLAKEDGVIVETEKGLQYGVVTTDIIDIEKEKLSTPIKPIIRKATDEDKKQHEKNLKDAEKALIDANEIAKELELDMKLLNASFTFDRNQLVFNFLADERIDFRALAKRLAKIYYTRIELRQIGVRDKAKIVGGYGQCGRQLCCHLFLNDLNAVSINMAKSQNLALNPQKINGCCGRLMCCLNYENEAYEEGRKQMAKVGTFIDTVQGKGRIISVDVVSQTYRVELEEKGIVTIDAK